MISPGMHYDAGSCRPAGGGSCSPAFCAAGSTTVVFYRQHVLKSMLKLSHSRMLSCGVLRVHDSQPRSSRMRKCLNVDLLSTQAYSCKCSSPRLFSAADMSLKCANMGTARIDFRYRHSGQHPCACTTHTCHLDHERGACHAHAWSREGEQQKVFAAIIFAFFFARGNRSWIGFLCMLHSKRVFSLSRTLGTRVLLSLKNGFSLHEA